MTGEKTASSEDARAWLERVLKLFARHAPLTSSRLEDGAGEIIVWLNLDGVEVSLGVRPRDAEASWAHTQTLSLSITSNTEQELPRETEHHLIVLKSLMDRADPVELAFPAKSHLPVRFRGRETDAAAGEHQRSAGELRFAAYVAWRALTSEDLYPHVRPLGDLVSERDVLDGWERTLGRVRDGSAPSKVGLYVHIPFCAVACTFCYCGKTDRFDRAGFDAYVDGLSDDMRRFAPVFSGTELTSIYFGGGTPSLLPATALENLLGTLRSSFAIAEGTQIIFEGNPDSLSEKKIEVLAKIGGVTRLTVGVQTLDAEAQRRARRFNKPEQVAAAVEAAKRFGINHVNVDLMAGLDGQSVQSFKDDMEFILGLAPDSIHINAFRPQPWTKYSLSGQSMSDEQVRLRDEMLAWGTDRLQGGGYSHMDQGQGKTQDAANIQDYDLRKLNGSLLGLGNPARSHSFGAHYYEPDVPNGDIDAALLADREKRRRMRAVPVDDSGERHRFLVHNLHTGFSLSEFRTLWGVDPWDVSPHGWDKLGRLGVVNVNGDRIESDCGDHADMLIYRVFLYSPEVAERVKRVWGPEFDTSKDYAALLRRMCERQADASPGAG
ncbi:MAG: radical SAM protein [Myxococcales bacterium]|nr:radical SAM protein [Myxococcales bacterium]